MASWEGRKRKGGGKYTATDGLLGQNLSPAAFQDEGEHLRANKPRESAALTVSPSPTHSEDILLSSWGTADPGPEPPPGYAPGSEGPSRPQSPPHKVPCGPTKSLPWYRARKVAGRKHLNHSVLRPPTLSESPPNAIFCRGRCSGNDVKTERPVDAPTRNRGRSRHLLRDASSDVTARLPPPALQRRKFTFGWAYRS